jgi:hypothetical protein
MTKEILKEVNAFPLLGKYFKTFLDRVTVNVGQLDSLKVKRPKLPETKELAKIRFNCRNMIKSILTQVKTYQLAGLATQENDLMLVSNFTDQYLKPIVKKSWSDCIFNLTKMYQSLDETETLQTSIDRLNMKNLFDELKGLIDTVRRQ